MTTQEMSNIMDTLLDSYNNQAIFGEAASKADIVLDEYEKSVLLTLALDIIVKAFFDRTGNQLGEGFDDSMRRLVDFSSLITVTSSKDTNTPIVKKTTAPKYDDRGVVYGLPTNLLILLNEKVIALKNSTAALESQRGEKKPLVVIPINYREYDRQMSKAYALPLKKQCWRLFQQEANSNLGIYAELIPSENAGDIIEYRIRYIRRPRPIVLTNLSFDNQEDLEIDGVKVVTECELNPILHMEIVNKAIELAITTRGRGVPQLQQQKQQ